MRADQIAFIALQPEDHLLIKEQLGLTEAKWILDEPLTKVTWFDGMTYEFRPILQFNYDFGIEIEIIDFVGHNDWGDAREIGFSHLGFHMADNEELPPKDEHWIADAVTLEHTSEYFKEGNPGFGKTYHYRIFRLDNMVRKYIKRVYVR